MPETTPQNNLAQERKSDSWYHAREKQIFLERWTIPILIIDPDKFSQQLALLAKKRQERGENIIAFADLSVTETIMGKFTTVFNRTETQCYAGFNILKNTLGSTHKVACRTQYYELAPEQYFGLSLLTHIIPGKDCAEPEGVPLIILECIGNLDFTVKNFALTPEQKIFINEIVMPKLLALEENIRINWGLDLGIVATLEQYL